MTEPEPLPGAPREILIVKPSSLGDVVHTLPCAAILRRTWPDTRIRWIVNSEWMPLLEGNPDIDEAIEFPRRQFKGVSSLPRMARWARQLRDRVRPDLILDYQGLFRSAVISRLVKGPQAKILGLSDAREGSRWFYHDVADTSGQTHAVDRYLALTRMAIGTVETDTPEWKLPSGELPEGLASGDGYIAFHPFSRGAGKSLILEQVEEFCRALGPFKVAVVGNHQPETGLLPENAVNLLNKTTLPQLIGLLRHARFTVSVDSGPMHIAAALTHRLVSIHTWSDPAKVGPYRAEAWVWKDGKLFTQAGRANPTEWRDAPGITALAEFVKTQL
jgi:ADP-heptose:LPS heptosyltransferase